MPPRLEVKIIRHELLNHEFIYLLPLGDIHIDEPQCDVEALQGYVNWVKKTDNAYILGMGDWFTAPGKEGAASLFEFMQDWAELGKPAMTIDEAENILVDIFKPVADKILAACIGGHEFNHCFRQVGHDPMKKVMEGLGVADRYARDGGALLIKTAPVSLKDDSWFTGIWTHGWGSARTRGAKLRKLEYLSQASHADYYVLGHDHLQNITRDNYLYIPMFDSVNFGVYRKLLVSSGSFRGYAGYPFRSGYSPADLGTPRIRLGKRLNEDGSVRKDVHAGL